MGFLSFLFGSSTKTKEFACPFCGKEGNMYMRNGVINQGQFEVLGKVEDGHLILDCKDCQVLSLLDPIWNKIKKTTADQSLEIQAQLLANI